MFGLETVSSRCCWLNHLIVDYRKFLNSDGGLISHRSSHWLIVFIYIRSGRLRLTHSKNFLRGPLRFLTPSETLCTQRERIWMRNQQWTNSGPSWVISTENSTNFWRISRSRFFAIYKMGDFMMGHMLMTNRLIKFYLWKLSISELDQPLARWEDTNHSWLPSWLC